MHRLKAYRALKLLTQTEVAKELGITRESYGQKENGKTEFTLSEIKKISELLGQPVEEIFFADGNLK